MKLVIANSKKKREIEGDFDICASEKDLRVLEECIIDAIGERDAVEKIFTFGWIAAIRERSPFISINGQKLEKWDD